MAGAHQVEGLSLGLALLGLDPPGPVVKDDGQGGLGREVLKLPVILVPALSLRLLSIIRNVVTAVDHLIEGVC